MRTYKIKGGVVGIRRDSSRGIRKARKALAGLSRAALRMTTEGLRGLEGSGGSLNVLPEDRAALKTTALRSNLRSRERAGLK